MENESPILWVPDRETVQSLAVGDTVLNCFGNRETVVEIFTAGDRTDGKAYVCYYSSDDGGRTSISGSLVEDELVRTTKLTALMTSWQLDFIERRMLQEGARQRYFLGLTDFGVFLQPLDDEYLLREETS